jgi:hypothetical protein
MRFELLTCEKLASVNGKSRAQPLDYWHRGQFLSYYCKPSAMKYTMQSGDLTFDRHALQLASPSGKHVCTSLPMKTPYERRLRGADVAYVCGGGVMIATTI